MLARRDDVCTECFEVEKKGRLVRPGNKPGLGIEINEKEVAKHPFQQEMPQRSYYADGAAGDW